MSSILNVVSQQTVDLKGEFGLALLITRCKATGSSTVITIPAPANTGTGATAGSKGTTRNTTVSIAALLDHGEAQSEVESQISGTSTALTVTSAANSTNARDTDVTVTGNAMKAGDTFTLVSLHRQTDLSFTEATLGIAPGASS